MTIASTNPMQANVAISSDKNAVDDIRLTTSQPQPLHYPEDPALSTGRGW